MSSGRILVNGSDFYCGSGANSLCQLALKTDVGSTYVHPSEIQCNAASEISSLKSSVSSGKSQIASAITGKGVSTSSSASYSTMANNISKIPTGYKLEIGEYSRRTSSSTISSSAKFIITCDYSSSSAKIYIVDTTAKTCIQLNFVNKSFSITAVEKQNSGQFRMHDNIGDIYYNPDTGEIETRYSGGYYTIT